MRTRTQNLSGINQPVNSFGIIPNETMVDDPDFNRKGSFKEMTVTKTRVLSNPHPGKQSNYRWSSTNNDWVLYSETTGDPLGCAFSKPFFGGNNTAYGSTPSIAQPAPSWGNVLSKYGKSDVNIGVFLAELRDTVRLFHKPWTVAAYLRSARVPGNIRRLKDAVNFVSSTYMEGRYGWRPFLSDVKGFSKLSQRLDQYSATEMSKDSVFKTSSTSTADSTYEGRGYCNFVGDCWASSNSRSLKKTTTLFGRVASNPSTQASSVAAEFARFYRLADIGSIAWELVPYSFVIDWFIPVGDKIASMSDSPSRLISVGDVWSVVKTTDVRKFSSVGISGQYYKSVGSYSYSVEQTVVTRGKSVIPPKPSEIDGYQTADLLVMAGQKLGPFFGKSFQRLGK